MKKKCLVVCVLAASAFAAQAADFGQVLRGLSDLQKAVQQGGATAIQQGTSAENVDQAKPISRGSNRREPDWMVRYPRAQLRKEFLNPFDRASIPLTMPGVGAASTRFAVPVEGKITMLQYDHEADDSPLLIQRHYDALLAQQGFERVIACASPCPTQYGAVHWMKMLDPNRIVDSNFFPDAPLILIGYKANAVAFVAVGKSPNVPYASFVKLVEGAITDRSDLDAWLASLKPSAPPAPAVPALVAPQATAPSKIRAAVTSSIVETISPGRLESAIRQTRGRLFILLSSEDRNCPFCIAANPTFADLADRHADAGRFVRVTWEPWRTAFEHKFVVAAGVNGLPTYLSFTDGVLDGRVAGNYPVADLEQKLIRKPKESGQ